MARRVATIAALLSLWPLSISSAQNWWNSPRYIGENADGYFYDIADLDQDGDPDLVSSVGFFFYPTHMRVFLNDGAGEFSPLPTVSLPTTHEFTEVRPGLADVTDDGVPDLLLRARSTSTVAYSLAVFPGIGGGQFGAMILTPFPGDLVDIDVGDNDADGRLEVAVAHRVTTSATSDVQVRWLDWNGAGFTLSNFVHFPHLSPLGGVESVESFDFSGDGIDDIAVGSYYNPTIHLLPTLGGRPTNGPSVPIPLTTTSGVRLTKGDIDGDGITDLFAAGMSVVVNPTAEWGHFRWLRFSAAGTFVTSPETGIKDFPDIFDINGCRLGDWDGDGELEMISNTWGTIVGQDYDTELGVFEVIGGVSLALHTRVDGQGHAAGVADLNGDGHLDAVAPRAIVFGDGEFTPLGPEPTALTFGSLLNTPRIAVVDWEGDGDLDILDADERLTVNDCTGDLGSTFNDLIEPWPTPPANYVYEEAVAIADFNGDGRPDYLVPFSQIFIFTTIFQEMRLLQDDGAGGYKDVGNAAAPGVQITDLGAAGLAVPADIDGDGDLDLLSVDGAWNNQGLGFFNVKLPIYQGIPRDTADADLDGDVDVLATLPASPPDSHLEVWTQQPGMVFTKSTLVTAELSTYTGAFLDVDEDGDQDVLAGGRSDGAVYLFRNDGASHTLFSLSGATSAGDVFALDDVDGDGTTDLLTATAYGVGGVWGLPRVQVFRRSGGPGSLLFDAARTWIATGASAFGDIDEDGDLDLIGRRVVRNRRYQGVEAGVVRQYGDGTAGTGGAVPVLGANGPVRPGSTTAEIRLRRGLGGSTALFVAGLAEGNLPMGLGTSLLVQPPLFFVLSVPLGGTPGATGEGSFDFDVTAATAAAAGLSFYHQMFVVDPAHPLGAAASNGLELIYGL